MIGEVIFSQLNNATTADERIYPLILPEAPSYPAITYQVISSVATHAMGQDGPLTRVRVQVNAWGTTYAEARTLANAIYGRLSRFRGLVGTMRVLDVLKDNEVEGYESEAQLRRVSQDFTLFVTAVS